MKGKILDFSIQTGSGIITTTDGQRFTFIGSEWNEKEAPVRGMAVDFDTQDGKAVSVYSDIDSAPATREESGKTTADKPREAKNRTTAGLLAIFLGSLGIHKFYMGYTGPALAYLIICLFCLLFMIFVPVLYLFVIILCIIAIIEGVIYLGKTDEDFNKTYVASRKNWF